MAGLNSIQRPYGAPLPKTDVQLAREAYQYVNRQIKKYRERRQSKAEGRAHQDAESGSIMSRAETLVVDESDDEKKDKEAADTKSEAKAAKK
ncbi:hypothetical protein N7468_000585 [Penicillium chermesinum]|uniref:Uncharacterized protein n=1 Tax=Penicillium chermesinum TaxID=63820 RepID=A0A9W9PLV3_9EURO|nr:uncharacterized protein N7468_000585 [Penicillium chermesinum]KAJ5249134.1 hypothetical protein N7468_000585 [Penicillium chermesinum]KAJ6151232.1 hypothetical protein N7470_007826 [Penicillium chermesinum]